LINEVLSRIPDEGSEALRDLVRAREAAKRDQLRAHHRPTRFCCARTARGSTTENGSTKSPKTTTFAATIDLLARST
jgi:hypothetical protein